MVDIKMDCTYVDIYFNIIKNSSNTIKQNESVREYILKYVAKREAINMKLKANSYMSQRLQKRPKKI